jgi:hypothetical protein
LNMYCTLLKPIFQVLPVTKYKEIIHAKLYFLKSRKEEIKLSALKASFPIFKGIP